MSRITYRQLEVFLAVCEAGSFRSAADRLFISEAAVSNHIAKLEDGIGGQLFRRGRGLAASLTEIGTDLRERSEQIIVNGRPLVGYTHSARKRAKQVNVYAALHLLDTFIRPALPVFFAEHQGITLNFVSPASSKMVLQGIDRGAVDVAIMTVRNIHELPGSKFISDMGSGLYAHPSLAERAQKEGFQSIPYILSQEGTNWGTRQVRGLRRMGINDPIIATRTGLYDVAINMALMGLGATPQFDPIVRIMDKENVLLRLHNIGNWQNRMLFNSGMEMNTYSILKSFFFNAISNAV